MVYLYSVTNYTLHKGLYSGHNDHNYFEIAHTITRTNGLTGNIRLYNFVDNHDVERIASKLIVKEHFEPVHILLYTLPGIPSIYYGSEFAIEGKKERFSDASLRPQIELEDHKDDYEKNPATKLICALGKIHGEQKDLVWGDYRQLMLTNRQFAFARGGLIIAVNNDDKDASITVDAAEASYVGLLRGELVKSKDGKLSVTLPPNSGEIFAPGDKKGEKIVLDPPKVKPVEKKAASSSGKGKDVTKSTTDKTSTPLSEIEVPDIPYEKMTVEQLQAAILAKMAKNGPVTDQMRRDVEANIWQDSLINWVKSFR